MLVVGHNFRPRKPRSESGRRNRSANRRTNQIIQVRLLNVEQWRETNCTQADTALNHNGWCRERRDTSHRIAQITSIRAGGIAWQAGLLLLVSAWRGYHRAVRAGPLTPACRTKLLLRRVRRRTAVSRPIATHRITSEGEGRHHIPWRGGNQVRQQANQGYQASPLIGHAPSLCTQIASIGQSNPFSTAEVLFYFSSANPSTAFSSILAFRRE
jgi:hypothetical protein